MKLPTTEPLFAGGTVDVDRLNGHKLRTDLSTEEARARLLTDAERQELNGAAHAVPAARLNGSAAAIGHNSGEHAWSEAEIEALAASGAAVAAPPYDDVVQQNRKRGILITQRDVLIQAIRDPRLSTRHQLVLAAIVEHMHNTTGAAFPGRRRLAEEVVWYDHDWAEHHYTEPGIAKTISELIDFGYLAWARRAVEECGRAITHYAPVIIQDLHAAISAGFPAHRREVERKRKADVTPGGNVTPIGNVTLGVTSEKLTLRPWFRLTLRPWFQQ